MTDRDDTGSNRVPPLNLSQEEVEYLWEMLKREVGKDEVQYSDGRDVVESLHTKVRNLTVGNDD